jgi:ribosomal protein L37AE/L43A
MSQTLRCPRCGSNHVLRQEQIWLQGQSTVSGPRYTTTRISDLAQRHAPPSLPRTSGYWYGRLAWHAGLALAPLGIAMFCLATRGSMLMVGTCTAIGLTLVWGGWPRGRMSPDWDQMLSQEHDKAMARYRRQWACLSCGGSFQVS